MFPYIITDSNHGNSYTKILHTLIIWQSDYKKKQVIRIQSWYRGVCGKKVSANMRIERAAMLKMVNLCAELITGKRREETRIE